MALKAENGALRARAEMAERDAEVALRRRLELQEVLNAELAKNAVGDPATAFGSSTVEEGSSVAFRGLGRGRVFGNRH